MHVSVLGYDVIIFLRNNAQMDPLANGHRTKILLHACFHARDNAQIENFFIRPLAKILVHACFCARVFYIATPFSP